MIRYENLLSSGARSESRVFGSGEVTYSYVSAGRRVDLSKPRASPQDSKHAGMEHLMLGSAMLIGGARSFVGLSYNSVVHYAPI